MNLRFSRSSLNLIIFACIILIGWASIDKNRTHSTELTQASEQQAITDITLPALTELQYKTWSSREGVDVVWQTRLDTHFRIRLRGQLNAKQPINNISDPKNTINWHPHYWQWDISLGADFEQGLPTLATKLKDFPVGLKQANAVIILQGPWGNDIAKLTSARIIKSLNLQPLEDDLRASPTKETDKAVICPWQPVSAQFWLRDQLLDKHQSQPSNKNKHWYIDKWPQLPAITPSSLQIWKHTFVQQWQSSWPNSTMQFDILADLAYYRLPQNYLLQGYWGINALNVRQLEEYLAQCSAPEPTIE